MKKTISYIITVILSISVGCGLMYGLIYFYPNVVIDTVSKIEKDVTVTDKGIAEGISNVYDAVVVVQNYNKNTLAGVGSGFIYDEKGYIMTNHHVVEGASELKVILSNGETVDAKLIGSDQYADIAVIQIDKKHITKVAKIGSSDNTKVGDTVFTIGSPVSADYAGTVTRGILSGKNRMVEVAVSSSRSKDWVMNVMQTDAAINPGNSGGPLCNVNGDVIGINSMKIVESSIEGIGFSIPIEDAVEYANMLVKGEKIKRSYLGIEMADVTTSAYTLLREGINLDSSIKSGVVVSRVIEGQPCAEAGIEKGDVIVKIGDKDIANVAKLRYYLYEHNPGDEVEITVIRVKESKKYKVTLGSTN